MSLKFRHLIDVFFKFSEGGEMHAKLTNALLYMIGVDDNPLSLSEKRGFKHFTKVHAS